MATIFYALPFLGNGLLITLWVSLLVVAFSLALGLVFGVGIVFGPKPVRWVVRLFSDCVRGIPILVLIFAVYYGLPPLGLDLNAF